MSGREVLHGFFPWDGRLSHVPSPPEGEREDEALRSGEITFNPYCDVELHSLPVVLKRLFHEALEQYLPELSNVEHVVLAERAEVDWMLGSEWELMTTKT